MDDEPTRSTFGDALAQYKYSTSSSPLKRKSPSLHTTPLTTKRFTRSTSARLSPSSNDGSTRRSPTKSPHSSPRLRLPNIRCASVTENDSFSSITTTTTSPSTSQIINNLTDSLAPDLLLVFIGVNPGLKTAATGHAYAHPSNLYWKLMHHSGLTRRRCAPTEDHDLPRLYSYGHTNIVTRPTRDASMLATNEMDAGVAVLEDKCRRFKPDAVCLVGKGIWEAVWRVWKGRPIRKEEFAYGWQLERMGAVRRGRGGGGVKMEEDWEGAKVFVATTTSGLAAGMSYGEKLEVWKELGDWVKMRRRERLANGQEVGEEVLQSMKSFSASQESDC